MTRSKQLSAFAFDTFPSLIHSAKAALMIAIMHFKRRALAFIFVSNKFTLSDIMEGPAKSGCVVLVPWVDSAESTSLVEEISI